MGEVGQAGSDGVLLSQQNALVYYGVHVNDVYAYFLSGQKLGRFPNETDFPYNRYQLAEILAFTKRNYDVELEDPDALVMELKTSWVDHSTIPKALQDTYVTIEAEVPVYKSIDNNSKWIVDGSAVKTLVLVGIHIVGTVEDHPEFVWATFEHMANAPDATYYYTDSNGQTQKQAFNSDGTFLFTPTGATKSPVNKQLATAKDHGVITANTSAGIVGSTTVREDPWGSTGNSQDAAVVKNNTLLLSINNSVLSKVPKGDVRRNYVQVGGIWTTTSETNPVAPIPNQGGDQTANMRGSLNLANATMETYVQGTNCFSCHQLPSDATNSFGAFDLSHIYSTIIPLKPKN